MLGLLGTYTSLAVDAAAVAAYPLWMRWLARCVSVGVYAGLLLYLARGWSLARNRPLVAAGGIALGAGVALTLAGAGEPAVFVIGQLLVGLGNPVVLVAWGDYLAGLDGAPRRSAIVLAALVDAALMLMFRLASAPVASALYLAVVVASFVPLLIEASRLGSAQTVPPKAASLGSVAHAIPWELVLLMACYALLYRTLQNFDHSVAVLTPVVRAVVTAAVALALWFYLRTSRSGSSQQVTMFLFGLAATALVLIPFSDGTLSAVASAIASSCWPLFYYLLWMILLDIGSESRLGSSLTFAAGWLALNVELVLAAPVAWALSQQVSRGALSMTALMLVLVYTLLVASLLLKRKDTGSPTGQEAHPEDTAPANAVRSSMEELCCAAAERHGLTQREGDVLQLLARGRSVPFIADALSISQSTTKGHVRHIYAKMGVASKQELLTRLEEGQKQ